MSSPSESEVRAAIETIRTSYSYDPPSRWLASHQLLRSLRITLDERIKPYRWITIVGSILGIAVLIALIWSLFEFGPVWWGDNPLVSTTAVSTAFLLPTGIMSASKHLERALATRRHPLMKLKDAIDAVATRFEDKYVAAASSVRS